MHIIATSFFIAQERVSSLFFCKFATMITYLKRWKTNARDVSLPQSITPAILAITMAWGSEGFSLVLALCALLGVAFLHLGLNLFDDYFDFKHMESSHRDRLQHAGVRSRIAKCHYITSGEATMSELLRAALIFCGVALMFGLPIFVLRGADILWVALVGAAVGISYSGMPLKLSYRGLGDLVIGLMFGPILMTGVYMAASGGFDVSILWVSIPVGLWVTNIVYSHAIMDYEPDKQVGKRTLAVLIGSKRGMLAVSALIQWSAYIIVAVGVVLGAISAYYLAVLVTLPMSIGLWLSLRDFIRNPHDNPQPKWWMGSMGDWAAYEKAGLGWFMVRWLTARNIISTSCLVIALVNIVPKVYNLIVS